VVSAQRELERDLRAALARRELELFYQPRLDLRSPHKIAVEALMRWRRPGRGVVLPEAFLDVAQAIGLSPQLDRWAIEHACRQAARWRQAGMVTKIAVNLCGRQASEPQLAEELAEILEQTRLPPQSLELELTERAVIDAGSETTTDCLQRVSDLGVSLAIDDFGSGFSSFAYLRRLPVQTIKIDGSFIAQIGRNRADETIIRAIIDLCHGLGKRVVGEGVETGRQLAFLAAHGCDEVQGFLFCRPLPASETEDYLARPWLRAARRGGTQPTLVTAGSALSGRS
jgi:EAL domain-containing protein (putative c-di-GMP-specific phosphodiesterase class I)